MPTRKGFSTISKVKPKPKKKVEKEHKGSFAAFNKNMDIEEKENSGYYTKKKVEELDKKLNDSIEYSRYLYDKINELHTVSHQKEKDEIFMIFYINVDGLTRQQSEEQLSYLTKEYEAVKSIYDIKQIWFPVKDQPTKLEIVNPKLINGDIVKAFKNLVDSLDNEQYKDLVNNL